VPDSPGYGPTIGVRLSGFAAAPDSTKSASVLGVNLGDSGRQAGGVDGKHGRSLLRSRAESIFGESDYNPQSRRYMDEDDPDANNRRSSAHASAGGLSTVNKEITGNASAHRIGRGHSKKFRRRQNGQQANESLFDLVMNGDSDDEYYDDDFEGAICCGPGGIFHILTCGKYCGDGRSLLYDRDDHDDNAKGSASGDASRDESRIRLLSSARRRHQQDGKARNVDDQTSTPSPKSAGEPIVDDMKLSVEKSSDTDGDHQHAAEQKTRSVLTDTLPSSDAESSDTFSGSLTSQNGRIRPRSTPSSPNSPESSDSDSRDDAGNGPLTSLDEDDTAASLRKSRFSLGSNTLSTVHDRARQAVQATGVAIAKARAASTTIVIALTRLRRRCLRAAKRFRFQIFLVIVFLLISASVLVLKSTANFEGILLDNIELVTRSSHDPKDLKTATGYRGLHTPSLLKDPFTTFVPPPTLTQRIVHIDMKGLPPTPMYLLQLLSKFAEWGATGVMIEWEDMLPYYGALEFLSSPNAYSPNDVAAVSRRARQLGLQIIPVVPSVSGCGFMLKHRRLSHLRERPESVDVIAISDPQSLRLIKLVLRQTLVLLELIHPDPHKDAAYLALRQSQQSRLPPDATLEDELADGDASDLTIFELERNSTHSPRRRRRPAGPSDSSPHSATTQHTLLVHLGGSSAGSDTFAGTAAALDLHRIGLGTPYSQLRASNSASTNKAQEFGIWNRILGFLGGPKNQALGDSKKNQEELPYSPMARIVGRRFRMAEKSATQRREAAEATTGSMPPPTFIGKPCRSCTLLGLKSEAKLVARHLGALAHWLREKHGADTMIWDEGVRSWDATDLERLADEDIQLAVRVFSPSMQAGSSAPSVLRNYMWNTYRGVFSKDALWGVMAYKGADLSSVSAAVVAARDRLENARNWLKLAAVNKLERIILAGPSRASHMGPLYEPISSALPTLALSLHLFKHGEVSLADIRRLLVSMGIAELYDDDPNSNQERKGLPTGLANTNVTIRINNDQGSNRAMRSGRLTTNGIWTLSRPGELELRSADTWMNDVDLLAFPGALALRFLEQFQALRNVITAADRVTGNHIIKSIGGAALPGAPPSAHLDGDAQDGSAHGSSVAMMEHSERPFESTFIPATESAHRLAEVIHAGKELLSFAKGMLQAFYFLPDINEMLNNKLGKGLALSNRPFVPHRAGGLSSPALKVVRELARHHQSSHIRSEMPSTATPNPETPRNTARKDHPKMTELAEKAFDELAASLYRLISSRDTPTVIRRHRALRHRRWLFTYGSWLFIPVALISIWVFLLPYGYKLYQSISESCSKRRNRVTVASESSESVKIASISSSGSTPAAAPSPLLPTKGDKSPAHSQPAAGSPESVSFNSASSPAQTMESMSFGQALSTMSTLPTSPLPGQMEAARSFTQQTAAEQTRTAHDGNSTSAKLDEIPSMLKPASLASSSHVALPVSNHTRALSGQYYVSDTAIQGAVSGNNQHLPSSLVSPPTPAIPSSAPNLCESERYAPESALPEMIRQGTTAECQTTVYGVLTGVDQTRPSALSRVPSFLHRVPGTRESPPTSLYATVLSGQNEPQRVAEYSSGVIPEPSAEQLRSKPTPSTRKKKIIRIPVRKGSITPSASGAGHGGVKPYALPTDLSGNVVVGMPNMYGTALPQGTSPSPMPRSANYAGQVGPNMVEPSHVQLHSPAPPGMAAHPGALHQMEHGQVSIPMPFPPYTTTYHQVTGHPVYPMWQNPVASLASHAGSERSVQQDLIPSNVQPVQTPSQAPAPHTVRPIQRTNTNPGPIRR